jgi:hypothetical protein
MLQGRLSRFERTRKNAPLSPRGNFLGVFQSMDFQKLGP